MMQFEYGDIDISTGHVFNYAVFFLMLIIALGYLYYLAIKKLKK